MVIKMIDIKWNKKSLNQFYKKMENLLSELPENTKLGVEEALKNTQKKALENKRGSKDKKMIPIEIVDFDKMKVVGRVYTDKDLFSYAPFLEFGTGTKAELDHIGTTKTFIESGYQYWLLPVDKVDRKFAPERIINIKGNMFYIMYATRPYPFMRPASFSSRKESADLIKEKLELMLKEVLK